MNASDDDLLELWEHVVCLNVSVAIIAEYRRYLREFAAWSGTPLIDATPWALVEFMAVRRDRWAPGTLMIVRRGLRSFYKWATEQDLIDENPALAIPAVKVPEVPVRVADEATRAALRLVARTTRDMAIIEVLFATGARRSEVGAFTVADVNVNEQVVQITRSKNGKTRLAALDYRAAAAVSRWLTDRGDPSTNALWTTRQGEPLTQDGFKTALRRLARQAGVEFSAHDARRGKAIAWIAAGGTESGLQHHGGWDTIHGVIRYTRMGRDKLAMDEAHRLFP